MVYSRAAYAVFDIVACIESILEYKAEIEHKIQEVQKKIEDIENRARQGFALGTNCFRNPLECNPDSLNNFFEFVNEDPLTGELKVYEHWGFGLGLQDSPLGKPQEELLKDIEVRYTYNRGQGEDLKKLRESRDEINGVVSDELALMFAKGAALHNELQNETDKDLYYTSFPNGNLDEILNAQNNVAIMSATRLAHILELKSNMISTAATAASTLQNQENLEE